jgi:hypothetical protein
VFANALFRSSRVFVRRLWLTAATAALNSHKRFQHAHCLGISSWCKVERNSLKTYTSFQVHGILLTDNSAIF